MKNVCFTGHRQLKNVLELEKKLIEVLENFIADGTENFYAGGAVGWDNLCSAAVLSLKKKYPQIKLHLILPCSNAEQTAKWSDGEKAQFYNILRSADSTEYTSVHYTSDCMKKRNARLVQLADCCVCYYSGMFRSGTGQTVRMAERKGIKIYNIYKQVS